MFDRRRDPLLAAPLRADADPDPDEGDRDRRKVSLHDGPHTRGLSGLADLELTRARLRDRVLHDPAWGAVPPWADRPDDRTRAGP